jgi:hypothetical protein
MLDKIQSFIEDMKYFDPLTDNPISLPSKSGFYIMCLKENVNLPSPLKEAHFSKYKGLKVLYVGITTAVKGIKGRDYRNHFNGNAGGSTLRKSLGVLFNYKLIPRDKNLNTNKKKFSKEDENILSEWMKNNIIFYYKVFNDPKSIEQELINLFNPPINLDKTKHLFINKDIRDKISFLRSRNSPLIVKF